MSAPASANASQIAAPIPFILLTPVTTAIFPCNDMTTKIFTPINKRSEVYPLISNTSYTTLDHYNTKLGFIGLIIKTK
ncbi:hypothetical protein B1no1_06880 [Thermolongibacillus altinsuensis]|nr:hypothetical protein B1no1_06880 [Thermolongibacillus altinsuensis]